VGVHTENRVRDRMGIEVDGDDPTDLPLLYYGLRSSFLKTKRLSLLGTEEGREVNIAHRRKK
jgi:hypothetical protein